ncbi:hypothetical protein [Rhizobium leguminosarum]|uniref:hypothetical protein n=1 Tax=Rhizobium leguminosarum TaxID=384 RepID=UPI0028A76462|nr:hypothetical protein [Rhizobium leguminosarum]
MTFLAAQARRSLIDTGRDGNLFFDPDGLRSEPPAYRDPAIIFRESSTEGFQGFDRRGHADTKNPKDPAMAGQNFRNGHEKGVAKSRSSNPLHIKRSRSKVPVLVYFFNT